MVHRTEIENDPAVAAAREHVLLRGAADVSTGDLLRCLLGRDAAADALSGLLRQLGGLRRLSRRPPRELAGEPGVDIRDAIRVAAAFELGRRGVEDGPNDRPLDSGSAVYARFRGLAQLENETFWALALDARNRLLRAIQVGGGSLAHCVVRPADVLTPVLREGAVSTIVLHNHPSGDPEPSAQDTALTRRLAAAAELVGLRLLDHVVIAAGGYASLRERGWVKPLPLEPAE